MLAGRGSFPTAMELPCLDIIRWSEDLDDPCQFRETDDPAVRDIGDMGLAHERHHVMFAMALDLHVLEKNQLVVVLDLAEGFLQRFEGVGPVAPVVLVHRLHDPFRGIDQAFSFGIFADVSQQ